MWQILRTPKFAIPAAAASLGGVGLDAMCNSLANAYPGQPHLLWISIFWCGALLGAAFPIWTAGAFALHMSRERKSDLEIVFRRDPRFISSNVEVPLGSSGIARDEQHYRLAVHNRSTDKTLRNVALSVVECQGVQIAAPLRLEMVTEGTDQSTCDLQPQCYKFFRFLELTHFASPRRVRIVINVCGKDMPLPAKPAKIRIKVAAFADNAYSDKVFDLEITPDGLLKVQPFTGEWNRGWGSGVVGHIMIES